MIKDLCSTSKIPARAHFGAPAGDVMMTRPIGPVEATKKSSSWDRMKRIKLFIHEPLINKVTGCDLNLLLNDRASLVDAISEVDKTINSKGSFPVPDYQSLLHMIYNPVENRFYKQVAITAYEQSGQMPNVRDDPKKELPQGTTITLIPAGGCITEWEEAIGYEKFLKATYTNNLDRTFT